MIEKCREDLSSSFRFNMLKECVVPSPYCCFAYRLSPAASFAWTAPQRASLAAAPGRCRRPLNRMKMGKAPFWEAAPPAARLCFAGERGARLPRAMRDAHSIALARKRGRSFALSRFPTYRTCSGRIRAASRWPSGTCFCKSDSALALGRISRTRLGSTRNRHARLRQRRRAPRAAAA